MKFIKKEKLLRENYVIYFYLHENRIIAQMNFHKKEKDSLTGMT